MEKGQFFQGSYNYKGNRLNKDIKKENFKKDLMNLIETNHQINMTSDHSVSSNNHQINMTSDHSVSSNNSFKTHLNDKGFNMFFTL